MRRAADLADKTRLTFGNGKESGALFRKLVHAHTLQGVRHFFRFGARRRINFPGLRVARRGREMREFRDFSQRFLVNGLFLIVAATLPRQKQLFDIHKEVLLKLPFAPFFGHVSVRFLNTAGDGAVLKDFPQGFSFIRFQQTIIGALVQFVQGKHRFLDLL